MSYLTFRVRLSRLSHGMLIATFIELEAYVVNRMIAPGNATDCPGNSEMTECSKLTKQQQQLSNIYYSVTDKEPKI